jgi:hypothetical protein
MTNKALYMKSLYCCEKEAKFTIGLEKKRKLHPVTMDISISSQYRVARKLQKWFVHFGDGGIGDNAGVNGVLNFKSNI